MSQPPSPSVNPKPSMVDALNRLNGRPWKGPGIDPEWFVRYDPHPGTDGTTLLMEVLKRQWFDLVPEALLWSDPAAVNDDGSSAWLYAALNNRLDVVDLLAPLLDVAAKNHQGDGGHSALHHATDVDVVERLIHHGVNVNLKADNGSTPLMCATQDETEARRRILKRLLQAGARVNEVNAHGDTALSWAVQNEHPEPIQALIQAGADVNHRAKNGDTLLMASLRFATINLETFNTLLAVSDPNATNRQGKTALNLLVEDLPSNRTIVETLLAAMDPCVVQTSLRPYVHSHPQVKPWLRASQTREQNLLKDHATHAELPVTCSPPSRRRL